MGMTMICIYLVRCAANPQPIFQGTPLRYQIAELPSTVAFGVIANGLCWPILCNHWLCVTRRLGDLPRRMAVGTVLVLVAWPFVCIALVFTDALAPWAKLLWANSIYFSIQMRVALPSLLARRRPGGWTAVMILWLVVQYTLIHFTVRESTANPTTGGWHSQGWGPFPWNGRVWTEILVLLCVHSAFVFLRNFDDGALVRIYMMIFSLFYVPLTSTAVGFFQPMIEQGDNQGWGGGLLFLILFPVGIPMLQLITLRKIQSRVVTDIVSWPGKDKEGAAAVTDRHAGDRNRYGVLFLRFEIRLPDAEIPKLYGAAGLARWDALARGLSVLTLPFYWTVVETLRKLVVVAVCAMMSESTQATARCVVLILVFSLWQLLVSRVRPYAANPLATLATGFERISLLHRVGSIDVNEVEVCLSVSNLHLHPSPNPNPDPNPNPNPNRTPNPNP